MTSLNDDASFMRAIRKNPLDMDLRKVYADWLEERQSPRAQYIRLMLASDQLKEQLAPLTREMGDLISHPEVGKQWVALMNNRGPGKNGRLGGYTLADGREIQITSIEQSITYAGLLEGVPNESMNQRMLDRLMEAEGPRYLVPPQITPIELASPYPFGKPERFPSVTCVGHFNSRQTTAESDLDYSALTIIWFQESYAFPIADSVVNHLVDMDWDAHAGNYEY